MLDIEMKAFALRDEICTNEYELESVQVYPKYVEVWVGGWVKDERLGEIAKYIANGLRLDLAFDFDLWRWVVYSRADFLEAIGAA